MAIETRGGAGIEGNAETGGGDFVNGAKTIQINKQGARELSKIHARLARLEIETTARAEKQQDIATELGRIEDRAEQREQRFEDLIVSLRADLVTHRETVRAELVTHRETVRAELAAQIANRPPIRPAMTDILSIVLAIALVIIMLVFSWLLWTRTTIPAGIAYWPWW